ncbi:hypothetical protein [Microbacterium sp. Marseille-Q6965]|uniref:hypothetical protein n=1 Tax=Microbacterium sp. Marseille-Q6965 TaxID=2965072 RepID=UPI0021B76546|nr:hypothetical protein [Microbacterium sp. Marseille-Q6965]
MTLVRALLVGLLGLLTAVVLAVIGFELVFAVAWGLAGAAAGAAVVIGSMSSPAPPLPDPPVEARLGLRHDVRHLSSRFDGRSGTARDEVRARARRLVIRALRHRGIEAGAPDGARRAAEILGPVARDVLGGRPLTLTALDDLLTRLERSDPSRKEQP